MPNVFKRRLLETKQAELCTEYVTWRHEYILRRGGMLEHVNAFGQVMLLLNGWWRDDRKRR
jgi:hypothetical protein